MSTVSHLNIHIVGTPAPQGSKRHVGGGVMIESSKKVAPWRLDVKNAALSARNAADHLTYTGPVEIQATFLLARPKNHYRTGRNAHLLRDNAATFVATKPDIDKLLRSTLDGLGEAGVWRDDSQVAQVWATKTYATTAELPGAFIYIAEVPA